MSETQHIIIPCLSASGLNVCLWSVCYFSGRYFIKVLHTVDLQPEEWVSNDYLTKGYGYGEACIARLGYRCRLGYSIVSMPHTRLPFTILSATPPIAGRNDNMLYERCKVKY